MSYYRAPLWDLRPGITSCLVSIGRPLWQEDGSAICSVITRLSESRRTRNHTLLSHLRLPQPGGPGSRISIPLDWTILFLKAILGVPGGMCHFGRLFLMVKYGDITQNTFVQSWTFTEIIARENCGLLAVPRIVPISWHTLSVFVFECGVMSPDTSSKLQQCYVSIYQRIVLGNPNDNYDMRAGCIAV
jgi:hypothetical protein